MDDDPLTQKVVRAALASAGLEPLLATDGIQALQLFAQHAPDCVILDVRMPRLSGLEVLQSLRQESDVPVLLLTANTEVRDRVRGLQLGADDYIVKPFSPAELVARVQAHLRRQQLRREPERVLRHGALELSAAANLARAGGEPLQLTPAEFTLLQALLQRPGLVCGRDHLAGLLDDAGAGLSARTVDSHMSRLRKKLRQRGADSVESVWGQGYRLK